MTQAAQRADISSKEIFGNHKLCAQFLKDYTDIPILKNVRPEDIENLSGRYHFFDDVELNADTVKRIRLRNPDPASGFEESGTAVSTGTGKSSDPAASAQNAPGTMYLVSLIEHKSSVDYDVSMQLLRYMVCIWYDWEKEMQETTDHKSRAFRYPPILPIVYYEGSGKWTAGCRLKDRIFLSELFSKYIPDFTYQVIGVQDYSNRDLLEKQDEISLLMLINKIQRSEDMAAFSGIAPSELNAVLRNADEDVVRIIAKTVQSLCRKLNLTDQETADYVGKVKERNMGYLFENMEKMDIQAERRKTEEEHKRANEEHERANEEREQRIALEAKVTSLENENISLGKENISLETKNRNTIRFLIETLQASGLPRDKAVQSLTENLDTSRQITEELVERYWK